MKKTQKLIIKQGASPPHEKTYLILYYLKFQLEWLTEWACTIYYVDGKEIFLFLLNEAYHVQAICP